MFIAPVCTLATSWKIDVVNLGFRNLAEFHATFNTYVP